MPLEAKLSLKASSERTRSAAFRFYSAVSKIKEWPGEKWWKLRSKAFVSLQVGSSEWYRHS